MWYHTGITSLLLFLVFQSAVAQQDLEQVLNNAPNQEAFWSVSVLDVNGKTIESYQSDKLIQTASNLKLFSSAAILDALGSDFTFKTRVYGVGELKDSVWTGDIVISGSGDPGISGTLYGDDRLFVFRSIVEQIKSKGIKRITGSVYADVSLFDDEVYPKGWDWDDLSFYYGVEISPLSFNNNTVDLVVSASGKRGSVPEISWFPFQTEYVSFINEQEIIHASGDYDEYYRRRPGSNTIILRSKLPEGYLEKESLSVYNAPLYFVDTFRTFLEMEGVMMPSKTAVVAEFLPFSSDDLEELAVHESHPLSVYISQMNKESDNFYAEMLLKSMSAYTQQLPGSYEKGVQRVKWFLSTLGVDTLLVEMRDASGMSSGTMTTTENLTLFLHMMRQHPMFSDFYESLAIAGVDGTLNYRMKSNPLRGRVRGKSGYMRGVRTLSGYLTTNAGNEIAFSIATNNFAGKVRSVDQTHEAILEYLYHKW